MGATLHRLYAGEVTRFASVALSDMDAAVSHAIDAAKDANVPQGLIVALLHAHAHKQTTIMVEDA